MTSAYNQSILVWAVRAAELLDQVADQLAQLDGCDIDICQACAGEDARMRQIIDHLAERPWMMEKKPVGSVRKTDQ